MSKRLLSGKAILKSTYAKLVISYVFIIVFITLGLCSVLYNLFESTSLKVIEADSRGRLTQNVNNLKLVQNRIFSLGYQMLAEADVIEAIYGEEEMSSVEKASLVRRLNNIMDSDSIIHSICLYNAATHAVIDTFGVESKEEGIEKMLNILDNYSIDRRFELTPCKIRYSKINGKPAEDNTVTAVFMISEYFKKKETSVKDDFPAASAVLINLDADAIQQSIASGGEGQESDTIVIDERGNGIFYSDASKFAGNVINESYINKILSSGKDEDCITMDVDGKKSLIVYRNIDAPDWTFINIYSFRSLFSEINRLGINIAFICMGVLLSAIIFSIITAKTIYSPFKRLVTKVKEDSGNGIKEEPSCDRRDNMGDAQYLSDTFSSIIQRTAELETSVNESMPMIKNAFLKELILRKCSFTNADYEKYEQLFKDLNVSDPNSGFCIVIFSVDEYCVYEGNEGMDGNMLLSSAEAVALKMLSEHFQCELIYHEGNSIYLLLRIENGNFTGSRTKQILNKLQHKLQELLNYKISCVAGMPVRNLGDIHLSYSSASDIMKYRLVYGFGCFLSYDMAELETNREFITVDKEKEKLLRAIKMCDIPVIKTQVNNIIDEISQCQYDYIMFMLNQLMLDIVKSAKAFYGNESEELNFNNIYSNLNRIATLEQMKDFFILYCKGVADRIEKKRAGRKSNMINEAVEYIRMHYCDCDITTEMLANIFNLTPGYFGKLFAEDMGKTANEYIVELRLLKAREMLKATGMTINDISSAVGFGNSTYFTTLFKKSFGVTPNQYRMDGSLEI